MPNVRVKENEPFEIAMRRFKRSCEKAGILAEVRRREAYEKPTTERKRKAELAARQKAEAESKRKAELAAKTCARSRSGTILAQVLCSAGR